MGQFRDCSEGCQALTELTGAVKTVVATTELRLKSVRNKVALDAKAAGVGIEAEKRAG